MREINLTAKAGLVFDIEDGEEVIDIRETEDGGLALTLMDEDGVVWDYLPDMANRPQAKAYLLGKAKDFND